MCVWCRIPAFLKYINKCFKAERDKETHVDSDAGLKWPGKAWCHFTSGWKVYAHRFYCFPLFFSYSSFLPPPSPLSRVRQFMWLSFYEYLSSSSSSSSSSFFSSSSTTTFSTSPPPPPLPFYTHSTLNTNVSMMIDIIPMHSNLSSDLIEELYNNHMRSHADSRKQEAYRMKKV